MTTIAAQPTLLFIPDISGFTQFVNETEITHSHHIIEELLEILIDSNEIGLKVSEIEGDAILFYKEGTPPTAAELLAQVQRMYVRFHAHLKLNEARRICQCGACSTATNLTLKFVVHHGETSQNNIKNHSKLFGKDVIVAHRLLKNEVTHDEYVLFTHDLINACSTWVQLEQAAWADPEKGAETYDFGPIEYCYVTLQPLEEHVPDPEPEDFSLSGELMNMMAYESEIEAPMDLVFNVISDLSIRHEWIPGIVDSDKLNGKITKNGSTHRCVIKRDDSDPYMVSHSFETGKDFISFVDTDHKHGVDTVFTLRKTGPASTQVEMRYLMKKNLIKKLIMNLFMKKKIIAMLAAALDQLNINCKKLVETGRQHPAQIVLTPSALHQELQAA